MTEKSAGWPVNFDITGPICARARKLHILRKLDPSGHHDWPVMSATLDPRTLGGCRVSPRLTACLPTAWEIIRGSAQTDRPRFLLPFDHHLRKIDEAPIAACDPRDGSRPKTLVTIRRLNGR